jgi:hypothetical protein
VNYAGPCCLLFVVLQAAAAQGTAPKDLRSLSVSWAEYYARVYRVPVDLVEAIIDEESGWNPYAISHRGGVGHRLFHHRGIQRCGQHRRRHRQRIYRLRDYVR